MRRRALPLALLPILLVLAGCTTRGPETAGGPAAPVESNSTVARGDLAFPVVSSVDGVAPPAAGDLTVRGANGVTVMADSANGSLRVGLGPLVAPVGGIIACGSACNTSQASAGMVVADGSLISHHDLALNALGPEGDSVVYFYDQGRQNGEYLQWSDAADRFQLSHDTEILGEALARGPVGTVSAASVPNGSFVFTPALEGNEMAVYLRGSATLQGGSATISFPPEFAAVVGAGAITAQATLTSPAPALYVSEKAKDHLTVQTVEPFNGTATFDYFVQAPRAGGEAFHTVR